MIKVKQHNQLNPDYHYQFSFTIKKKSIINYLIPLKNGTIKYVPE